MPGSLVAWRAETGGVFSVRPSSTPRRTFDGAFIGVWGASTGTFMTLVIAWVFLCTVAQKKRIGEGFPLRVVGIPKGTLMGPMVI